MIDYSLPDFVNGYDRNLFFIKLMADSPELFQEDIRIDSVYGCFPDCPLNGGRTFIRERFSHDQMEETFAAFSEQGVRLRFTFTNMLAEPEHLEDAYFLDIVDLMKRYDAEAILYSDLVDEFFRQQGIRRTLSTTRVLSGPDKLNAKLDEFDCVVLNYNRNKDAAFLDQVKHPERLEVMVNELCNPHCPHRAEHYLHNSRDQLAGEVTEFRRCDLATSEFHLHKPDSPTVLTNGDVAHLAAERGVHLFKMVGRGVGTDVTMESYRYYLLAPEFRQPIKQIMGG